MQTIKNRLAVLGGLFILLGASVQSAGATEYLVRLDGAVTTLSGLVSVDYILPGIQLPIKVTVAAGYSLDPTTGTVVPTTPLFLKNIIADVNTITKSAEIYKLSNGAIVVVRPVPVG